MNYNAFAPEPTPAFTNDSEVLVGATVRPDGSVDRSRALIWRMNPAQAQRFQEGVDRLEEAARQRRVEQYTIPESAKVGTATRTWYELSHSIRKGQERLEANPSDTRVKLLVAQWGLERALLDNITSRYQHELSRPATEGTRQGMTIGEARAAAYALPASEARTLLDPYIAEWEAVKAQAPDSVVSVQQGHFMLDLPVQEALNAGHDLGRRLDDQATRSV